jgi:PAS domain S-box-containing protein
VNDTAGPLPVAGSGHNGPDWSAVMAEAGAEARAILRAVTRMSPLPLVLSDPRKPDCPVVFCNDAFLKLTLYAEDEVLGRNCRFLQGPDSDPRAVQQLRDAVAEQREVQVDLWNYRKNGTRFWNSMFIGPVFNPRGEVIYFFGSQIDSTPRFTVEAERAAEQRLESLRAMARAAAQEVDGLMTIVVTAADRITKTQPEPWVTEQLSRIVKAARSTIRLSSQLLSFAGHQTLHPQIIDVNRLIAEFLPIASKIGTSKLRVESALHGRPLTVKLDPGQLNLALFSLMQNAAEAARASGGTVRLSTRALAKDEVEIAVSDDGTGMPADVAANARIPFFTTKEDRRSVGLGLSTTAGFCQQSNGRLLIESEAGKGTTIRMVFPRVSA